MTKRMERSLDKMKSKTNLIKLRQEWWSKAKKKIMKFQSDKTKIEAHSIFSIERIQKIVSEPMKKLWYSVSLESKIYKYEN